MKQILLFSLILGQSLSITAMQKPASQLKPSSLDVLPKDIRMLILQFVTGNSLDEAIDGIKRFYIASPKSRESVETMKAILSHLLDTFRFTGSNRFATAVHKLEKLENFPVFKNPEMRKWIDEKIKKLDDEQALRDAAEDFDVAKVKSLLAKKVDPNAKDLVGSSALMLATNHRVPLDQKKAFEETISLLLKAGANPNLQQDLGLSPLHNAAYFGQDFAVEELLKYNANPNLLKMNNTPLGYMGQALARIDIERLKEYKKIIELLLNAGADPNKGNIKIKNEIEASRFSDEEKKQLINLLRKHGLRE